MADLEELVVSLVAETSGLRAELSKAATATRDATRKMDDAISEFSQNSGKQLSFFETAAASAIGFLGSQVVTAAIGALADGLAFVKDQLKEGAEAAIREEDALKRLANSLAISGHYSAEAAADLQQFSSSMEEITGIGDDVVATNLAMLSSLTRLDSEGLQRAQKAAIDMSVALGMDLSSATNLVAKGIEGNVAMFKRYGIEIQEGATKAETMNNILRKLEGSFGGAAAGAAQTFGGAMRNLTNAWGNFAEAIATAITKNPVVIAMMNTLTDVMRELTKGAENSGVTMREVLGRSLIYTAQLFGVLAQIGDEVWRLLKAGALAFVAGLNTIAGTISWIGDKLGVLKDEDPFARLVSTSKELNDTMANESGLGKIATVLADMSAAGERAFSTIRTSSDAVTASIKNQAVEVENLSTKEKEMLTQFAQGLADKGSALDAQFQYESELRKINLETELAQLTEHNANKWDLMNEDIIARQELIAAQQEKEQADLLTARENNLITETQFRAAQTALAQKQYLETKKIEAEKTKLEQAEQAARTQGYMTFLDGISALQQSNSKELVAIGKAAAITKATIDAYLAIQNALANVPFPANIAASVGIGVMAFANVSKIAGIGFNSGGTLVGGGANVDSVPATLTKGETVVTRDLTQQLADFLAGQRGEGGGGGEVRVILELKDGLIDMIEAKILERQATNTSLLGAGVV